MTDSTFRRPDPCDYDLDPEKYHSSRRFAALREALASSRRRGLYMNIRDYYLAKRGEL